MCHEYLAELSEQLVMPSNQKPKTKHSLRETQREREKEREREREREREDKDRNRERERKERERERELFCDEFFVKLQPRYTRKIEM